MKKYVEPEMEIDLFEDKDGILTVGSGNWNCSCYDSSCLIHFGHGEGSDPFDR